MSCHHIEEALTFNDVSLIPGYSDILPSEVDIAVCLGKNLILKLPILSAAMDTVTHAPMAIAMAQIGALGIIHKNFSIKDQASEVRRVKEQGAGRAHFYCGAALGAAADLEERSRALVEAEVDVLVVDSAHGHSENVLSAVKKLRTWFKEHLIIAGNVVTAEGALALYRAGADVVKVGVGPGSICTTRVIAGVGVPQLSAIMRVGQAAKEYGFSVIADGGLQFSGDITKALAAGAHAVMTGSLLAGTQEAPGERIIYGGREYKVYRGMGSLLAMADGAKERYGQEGVLESNKLVPEGIEGRIPYRGSAADVVFQLMGGLRAGMGYVGAQTIALLHEKARFVKVSAAGLREGHVHDITITKEAPNYFLSA